ncbi:MAG: DUF5309 domain-containing protein [Candidatus Omnitrophica bacterium]|nr:DUF5309 domain-containing protein [Candidatus Omnitrophota bacterium]
MASPTNTFQTYDAIGNREDLVDVIYNVAPWETPLLSSMPSVAATGTFHEWQTDTLASPAQNVQIEGSDASTDATTATVRLGNYCAISDKVVRISGSQEAVDKAGRAKEMAYQLVKRGRELRTDIELMMFDNTVRAVGTDTAARDNAGIETWIDTATSAGAGGSDGSLGTTARTDGTQRAFTESLLLDVHQAAWTAGGNADKLYLGAFNKRVASGFTGVATKFKDVDDKKIIASADVYVSDFGELQIIPSRQVRSRSAILVDTSMLAYATLRNMQTKDLARTGDSERKQLICEWTLEVRNEAAHGIVADLTTA